MMGAPTSREWPLVPTTNKIASQSDVKLFSKMPPETFHIKLSRSVARSFSVRVERLCSPDRDNGRFH